MKRLLILAVIIIMVFSFSSCELADWFLGVVYPSGNKTISISLGHDYFDMNPATGRPIIVILVPIFITDEATGKWDVDKTKLIQEEFWQQDVINWDFTGLSPKSYKVVAYYDMNSDRMINQDEPSVCVQVDNSGGSTTFDFAKSDSPDQLSGNGHLGFSSKIDATLLSKLTGSTNVGETQYDLQLNIYSWVISGYCTLSLRDASFDNELMYNWISLDAVGNGYAYFWGIIDPPGADQKVVASFYDMNWVWQGDQTIYISGEGTTGYQTLPISF